MQDRYDELYRSFRWNVPERYNIAQACCGQWAADRGRFALYWEDESGASAADAGRQTGFFRRLVVAVAAR
jgi:acetyl-CoA synthetase